MAPIILFGRIKIRVDERSSIAVAPWLYHFRILVTPTLEPLFLFVVRCTRLSVTDHNRRFKMIGKSEN